LNGLLQNLDALRLEIQGDLLTEDATHALKPTILSKQAFGQWMLCIWLQHHGRKRIISVPVMIGY
jgi:hypothetical protein